MNFKEYNVVVTNIAYRELEQIKYYIANVLYSKNAANKLINLIEKELQRLRYSPQLYPEIEKMDELKRKYRRIVVKNYIILYILEQNSNMVYITHIYNGKRNYIYNQYL